MLTSSEVAAAMRMVLAVNSSRGAYLHYCNVAYSEYGILVTVAFWSCSFDWAACEVSYEGSWWDRDESFGVTRGALIDSEDSGTAVSSFIFWNLFISS